MMTRRCRSFEPSKLFESQLERVKRFNLGSKSGLTTCFSSLEPIEIRQQPIAKSVDDVAGGCGALASATRLPLEQHRRPLPAAGRLWPVGNSIPHARRPLQAVPRTRWVATLGAAAIVTSVTVVGQARAQRLPAPSEKQAIVSIVLEHVKCCSADVDPTRVKLTRIRVATVHDPRGRGWALVDIYATGVGGESMLLDRRAGAWKVVDEGTSDVGCGLAPLVIRVDLDLACNGHVP